MLDDHLVLAGGGHTHALILRRWCMDPSLRPKGLITLISRKSTTMYSGMLPGLIAGYYSLNEVLINLRTLSEKAKVVLVIDEIRGLNVIDNCIFLQDRPPIYFQRLSLDIGSEACEDKEHVQKTGIDLGIPIKPLTAAMQWIENQEKDTLDFDKKPLTVVGSGLSALEVVLALRSRWSNRFLRLQADMCKLSPTFKKALDKAKIDLIPRRASISGHVLFCTGSKAPNWLKKSNLEVDSDGRVFTTNTFQVINYPYIFAVGDCGVIKKQYRPASGVWAVRAAEPLARNLERFSKNLEPSGWLPQKRALQLIGGGGYQSKKPVAWASWGHFLIGPHHLLWKWKEKIDRKFMAKLDVEFGMDSSENSIDSDMGCRGCAAKLPSKPLKEALDQANLSALSANPEDSVFIASLQGGKGLVQSVDGFPALISDPWLNGRLTALHACSDLWATGACVSSAQAVITLPNVSDKIQKELLAQSLSGINSALEIQGAKLVGGHTVEDRSDAPEPISLGIQIALCVNGLVSSGIDPWTKGGFCEGDALMLSRGLGSGVLFAAARAGKVCSQDLDAAINELATSQHILVEALLKAQERNHSNPIVHACTDITGFGLLGHLEEMLFASNSKRIKLGQSLLRIQLEAELIPSLKGALSLLRDGYASTLAPANRRAWSLLDKRDGSPAFVELSLGKGLYAGCQEYETIMELIVDPQTCGPLLIACPNEDAIRLENEAPWIKIGNVLSI